MAHRVRLRQAEFARRAEALRLTSQRDQAKAIGVHESTHSRLLNGSREPRAVYMFGVLRLFPDAGVSDLFELVNDTNQAGDLS